MPSSKVRLRVISGDPVADVVLLDSRFNTVARGSGEVRAELEPGLYLARAIAANGVEEKPILLRGDVPEKEEILPVVWFDSPIPLNNTRTSHEYHQGPVARALHASLANPATDEGGLLLCLRDVGKPPTGPDEVVAAYRQAYRGLRLLGLDDTLLLDLDALPGALNLGDGLLLHETRLPVGRYQLEWAPPQGTAMRLPVLVRPEMTTQWYALVQGSVATGWRPDLANAAVAFSWNAGIPPADSLDTRLAERARHSLARGANLLMGPHLDEMLQAKFDNPMLGVLGAHLLLMAKKPRYNLIDLVLTNTGGLLGDDFPDVVALRLKFAALTHSARHVATTAAVPFPPLLRRSWDYLVEAAATLPDIIPAGSLAARIAGSLVNDGIWLAWRSPPPAAAAPPPPPKTRGARSARSTAVKVLGLVGAAAWLADALKDLGAPAPYTTPGTDATPATRMDLKRLLDGVIRERTVAELTAAADDRRDPADRARDLVAALVADVDWDEVMRRLRRREGGHDLAASLSDVERALLPSLRFARQHLEDGGELDRHFVIAMARSLGMPLPILLDALGDLARQLIRLALGHPADSP